MLVLLLSYERWIGVLGGIWYMEVSRNNEWIEDYNVEVDQNID